LIKRDIDFLILNDMYVKEYTEFRIDELSKMILCRLILERDKVFYIK